MPVRQLTLAGALLLLLPSTALAQHHERNQHHEGAPYHEQGASPSSHGPLQEPGHAIFGTVQEAIRALEADPDTDWSTVDLDRLRRHLLDMHQVAVNVEVVRKEPIEHGLRLLVRPEEQAAGALARVLASHPRMLRHGTGWQMEVQEQENGYLLHVTDPEGEEGAKIRGLGYIGLLAYGSHHQHHHWMMARGANAHAGDSTP